MRARLAIHHEDQQVGFPNCRQYLRPDHVGKRFAQLGLETTGIDDVKAAACPFRAGKVAIARNARTVFDNRLLLAQDAIEES
jgi:hypothetical protein